MTLEKYMGKICNLLWKTNAKSSIEKALENKSHQISFCEKKLRRACYNDMKSCCANIYELKRLSSRQLLVFSQGSTDSDALFRSKVQFPLKDTKQYQFFSWLEEGFYRNLGERSGYKTSTKRKVGGLRMSNWLHLQFRFISCLFRSVLKIHL